MQKYYVYRYIDKKSKEIVYIGKTEQLFVENRLNQHIDDNIGKYMKNNECTIEFITLPRKEDMDYIESYLIRKMTPICNTILVNATAPPFEINIPESLWKNVDEYLEEQKNKNEKIKKMTTTTIQNNLMQMQELALQKENKVKKMIENMTDADKSFIKEIIKRRQGNTITIQIKIVKTIYDMFKESSGICEIRQRLLSYRCEILTPTKFVEWKWFKEIIINDSFMILEVDESAFLMLNHL